jgi:hypothetical protein
MNVKANYQDLDYDTPVKDGDHDATLVKYFVNEAEKTYEINHGLGRIPQKIQIVYNPIFFESESEDENRVILTFFENKTTVILRFE